jgi:hypothetical protein
MLFLPSIRILFLIDEIMNYFSLSDIFKVIDIFYIFYLFIYIQFLFIHIVIINQKIL